MSSPASFYWFDYETFGTNPLWDRPCQFAGIRTDEQLNETGRPLVLFCRQSMDYLPDPMACKVTGLTPHHVNENGLCESRFIEAILEQIGKPGTCSLGYNSIRFDDEFTRHTLFRNFVDPYEHEYKDGNSRWDLLDVVRLTRALRPEGINWPVNDDGRASNRLEHLSVANGIEHADAHDALSDVRATIALARLIRTKQPKLFDFAYANKGKLALSQRLNVARPQISLLVSGTIPAARSHIAPILPLAMHPDNRNAVIAIDLARDPSELLCMSSEEINHKLYRNGEASDVAVRPGLRSIALNKCPVIVPFNTLRESDAERLGISVQDTLKHAETARALCTPETRRKIGDAMARSWPDGHTDVDGSLYSGSFLSTADRQRAFELRRTSPDRMQDIGAHFEDKRLVELAWRYQARNFPESLNTEQQNRWREHCHERLNEEAVPWLNFRAFDESLRGTEWEGADIQIKSALENYRRDIQQFTAPRTESEPFPQTLEPE